MLWSLCRPSPSRQAWMRSGVPAGKMRLCPLGIEPTLSAPALPLPLQLATGDRRRVHHAVSDGGRPGATQERGLGCSAPGCGRRRRRTNAVLIVKIGRYAPGWLEELHYRIEALQVSLGKRLPDAAPRPLRHRAVLGRGDARLYATATHYISLSFGEGWDQPMVEAAASGLRLIARITAPIARISTPPSRSSSPAERSQPSSPAAVTLAPSSPTSTGGSQTRPAAIACIRAAIEGETGWPHRPVTACCGNSPGSRRPAA